MSFYVNLIWRCDYWSVFGHQVIKAGTVTSSSTTVTPAHVTTMLSVSTRPPHLNTITATAW